MLPYKISVLVFVENRAGELLLIERARSPNAGQWSPIGGKLEMATGESPFECAAREVGEEIGLTVVAERDLHLFAMIAEKAYEGQCHWLMFLFRCRVPLDTLPPQIDEGRFAFYSRAAIGALALPETDRQALWPIWDQHRDGFVALRADCHPSQKLDVVIEQVVGGNAR
jgi:8-oxo-dGTP diphosphatase